MQPQDRAKFYSSFAGVCELYGKKASPELMAMYFEALRQHELQDVLRAFNLHAVDPDQGQFMPKPADIVRLLGGSKQTRALVAWSNVERALRHVGPYQSVVFDDPIIHAVLDDMGGWIDICNTGTEKDLEFKRNEFEKRYQGYSLQGGVTDYKTHLVGMIEADCSAKNQPLPKPVLLGNKDKAMAIFLQHNKEESPLERLASGIEEESRRHQ